MASCRNCGHTEKMCKCGGGRMSKAGSFYGSPMPGMKPKRPVIRKNKGTPTPTPEPSYENGFPIGRGEIPTGYRGADRSRRFRPSALTPPSFYIDPIDPKNEAAYDDYMSALDWESEDMGSGTGLIYEQSPGGKITSRYAPGYEYGKFPRGLVEGRKLFGMPGGRSARGVGTAKRMSKAQPYPPPPRPNPNVTEPYPDKDHYFGGGLRPGMPPRLDDRYPYPPQNRQNAEEMRNFRRPKPRRTFEELQYRPKIQYSGGAGVGTRKSMQKGSISVPDKLKSMINGLLGVGRFDNVNPSAVAAALIANRQGGTLGMENFAPRKSPSSIGPRKSDVINTINALMSRGRVRDPENPNFIPFKQRETLRRERMPSSGSGLDKSMMKSTKPRDPIPPRRRIIHPPPPPGWLDSFDNARKLRPSRAFASGVGGSRGMMKSISSMNQGGVRHVVGGYRGGKMSKAMAASQTQTKNRYM